MKIFEPNRFKFVILDDIPEKSYYEEVFNTILSDCAFDEINRERKFILKDQSISTILNDRIKSGLKTYGVLPKKIKNFVIQNISNDNEIRFEFINIHQSVYDIKKNIRTLPENIFPFREKLFFDRYTLNSILYNPDYLLNMNIKLIDKECIRKERPVSDKYEKYTLILGYIISLLHNKGNLFIMSTLLLHIKRSTNVIIKNNKLIFLPRNEIDYEIKDLIIDILLKTKKFTKYIDTEITYD